MAGYLSCLTPLVLLLVLCWTPSPALSQSRQPGHHRTVGHARRPTHSPGGHVRRPPHSKQTPPSAGGQRRRPQPSAGGQRRHPQPSAGGQRRHPQPSAGGQRRHPQPSAGGQRRPQSPASGGGGNFEALFVGGQNANNPSTGALISGSSGGSGPPIVFGPQRFTSNNYDYDYYG